MPQGIQCWDASGNLVADIGDYNLRLIGSVNITAPTGSTPVTTAYAGVTSAGYFAVPVAASSGAYSLNYYACRAYDGGIRTYATLPAAVANTLTINIYGFI